MSAVPHTPEGSRYFVQSLAKGLDVLASFDAEHARQTLSEVARRSGMTRASARRFLLTWVDLGFVEHIGDQFTLRPTVMEIGRAYLSMLTLPDVAEPHMRVLAASIGGPVDLTVLDGLDGYVLVHSQPGRAVQNFINVGERAPALSTASGRCMLAQLSDDELRELTVGTEIAALTPQTNRDLVDVLGKIRESRRAGYAIVTDEFRTGITSLAIPVYAGRGNHPSALTVAVRGGPATHDELIGTMLPRMQLTAHAIEADYTRALKH